QGGDPGLRAGTSGAAAGVSRAGTAGHHPRGHGPSFLRPPGCGRGNGGELRHHLPWRRPADEPGAGEEAGTRRRPGRDAGGARDHDPCPLVVWHRRGDAVGLQGCGRGGRRRGAGRAGDAGGARVAHDRDQGMRASGPLVAALSVAATLLALEGAVRLRLSSANRDALPHVGVDAETQRRLEWVGAGRAARGAEAWEIDIPDPTLGWRPKPGISVHSVHPGSYDVMVTTNPQGLRGARPALQPRRPGTTRVAVFGCPQTFGSGVQDDETFSARLEASLHDVEVLNFGVHGYGTDQMLLRWEREGVDYAPDVVVLAFAYYHLGRNVTRFRFYAKPRLPLAGAGALRLEGVPVPHPDTLARDGSQTAPWPLADRSVLLRWLWDRGLRRRQAELYQPGGPAWEVTRALIARFADTAQRHGV